jgi:DNA repair protein RAD5
LYTRSKTQFEGFVNAGLVLNRYVQILTLLLRLRQCCDHPFLVLGRERSDKEFDTEISRFMTRFTARVTENASDGGFSQGPSLEYLTGLADELRKKNGSGNSADQGASNDGNNQCPICLSPPEAAVLSECGHLYCRYNHLFLFVFVRLLIQTDSCVVVMLSFLTGSVYGQYLMVKVVPNVRFVVVICQ